MLEPLPFGETGRLENVLYGVDARDPLTFTLVPLLVGAVAIVATLLPAVRAARMNPIHSLKL